MSTTLETPPAWDIESEYPSISSAEFAKDEAEIEKLTTEMSQLIEKIRPTLASNPEIPTIQKILLLNRRLFVLQWNLSAYTGCVQSIDGTDANANAKESQIAKAETKLKGIFTPISLFLSQCPQNIFDSVFNSTELKTARYSFFIERAKAQTLLSEKEEVLLADLALSGKLSWSNLYDSLASSLKVKMEVDGKMQELGLAHASGIAKGPDEKMRKIAWQGIQDAWKSAQESAAAILNGLAGWRITEAKHRSHTVSQDFLSSPLFGSRIQRETLTAMMTALENNREFMQKSMGSVAKLLGKTKVDPWDLLAPPPIKDQSNLPYSEAIELISDAFSQVDPAFGAFVKTMHEKNWIEGRVLPKKRGGGYCTRFVKSQEPRIFMTYMGSASDVGTLAHEIGHAYHGWVMRDLSVEECEYPMTLAETASIFAEAVLVDAQKKAAKTREEKLSVAWQDMDRAQAFLLNIPARYEFEHSFYSARKEKTLSADEITALNEKAWAKWYGSALSGYDKMFWATKLHFSLSYTSFYNYPYTFGYLFSLSIYARREELGDNFMPKYIEILRDTGRMSVEDLMMKHLGEDIRKPQFWQKAIDAVKIKVQDFEKLVTPGH